MVVNVVWCLKVMVISHIVWIPSFASIAPSINNQSSIHIKHLFNPTTEIRCNNYECRPIPDISSGILFRRGLEAWCKGSNITRKEKLQKPRCTLPFKYRNMTYDGCTKLIEADRKAKVKKQDLLSLVFPDVFYCPTRNKNGKRKWRMGQCQDTCKKQFAKNSCVTVSGGSLHHHPQCTFPFDFKGSKKDGCIWKPSAEGLWCKIGIKSWSQCSSSCRSDKMLKNCSYLSPKDRIRADFPYQCLEKKLTWEVRDINETTIPCWLCKNINISTTRIPTNIHEQGFCYQENNCSRIQDRVPKHKESISMAQLVAIPAAFVGGSVLISLVLFIKRKLNTRNTDIQPDKLENVSTQSPSPHLPIGENEMHTQPDIIEDVGKEPTKERNMSIGTIFEKIAHSWHIGDASRLNPTICLNEQIEFIQYIPNREMHRKDFTVGDILGNGNFGVVYKGKAKGLFYPDSETNVAMKTIHDTSNKNDIDSFLAEIKILSNLDLHCNLVNMIGSYTSEVKETGEMWLLLEYCEEGDLKGFIARNRKTFDKCFGNLNHNNNIIENRILIKFAYHIAKGMEYLASKRIMHGDLAARNILIDCRDKDFGGARLVAKVADFGLSRKIANKNYYRKMERNYVPWKWMAFEFLEDYLFKLKSDVWSYGVVMWELFSLGREPYGHQTYDEVLDQLKKGYHLPCPEIINKIQNWPAKEFYDEVATKCFVIDVNRRSSFTELVEFIKSKLTEKELGCYDAVTNVYLTKNNLLLNAETRRRLAHREKGDRASARI